MEVLIKGSIRSTLRHTSGPSKGIGNVFPLMHYPSYFEAYSYIISTVTIPHCHCSEQGISSNAMHQFNIKQWKCLAFHFACHVTVIVLSMYDVFTYIDVIDFKYTYEESPWEAASGLRKCDFFGNFLMLILIC